MRVVYLDPRHAEFDTAVAEIAAVVRQKRCVPILGAGISYPGPSSLPLGRHLECRLRKALWASVEELWPDRPLSMRDRQSAERIVGEARLERMLDVLQQAHGSQAIHRFLEVLRGTQFNGNHDALAAWSKAGYLPSCVTLNFDLMIECAIADRGATTETVCPLREDSFRYPVGSSVVATRILKPHGSLAPAEWPGGEFDLIAPTLADVGNKPDPANEIELARLLGTTKDILVAGYSDHDWDIFPVIQKTASSHVYWVEFLSETDVRNRCAPSSIGYERVRHWLDTRGNGCVLLGDAELLLDAICTELSLCRTLENEPLGSRPVREAPIEHFITTQTEKSRTAVALALLLQDRGAAHEALARLLLRHAAVIGEPRLLARVHRSCAHSCHTRRDLRRALRHMRKCVKIKSKSEDAESRNVADDLVWMGYEHLCLIKRPGWRWLLIVPTLWHWWRGTTTVDDGLRKSRSLTRRHRRKLRALARFYRGDLLHSWGQALFLIRGRKSRLGRHLLRLAVGWYEKARRIDPGSMDWEYYWLRRVEAVVLAGDELVESKAVLERLEAIRWSYDILQNQVQLGNVLAYRALLCGLEDAKPDEPELLLKEAEDIWSATDGFVPSGLLRVVLFRRVLGISGRAATARQLLRLRSMVKAHKLRVAHHALRREARD